MKKIYDDAIENIKLEGRIMQNIEHLYKESPYCKKYIIKMAIKLMKDNNYVQSRDVINTGIKYFSKDNEVLLTNVQLLFLEGKYETAFENIPAEESNLHIFEEFKRLNKKIKNALNIKISEDDFSSNYKTVMIKKQKEDKLKTFKTLIDDVSKTMFGDPFSPSILINIQTSLLEVFLKLGKELGYSGLSKYAKDLFKAKPVDENKFYYVNSLIADGKAIDAERELEKMVFKNKFLKERLENLISREKIKIEEKEREEEEKRKRQRENEKRRKQEQERQWKQQQYQHQQRTGQKQAEDYKGYYKILGASKNDSTDAIKKKYKKLAVKKDPDNYRGNDPKVKEKMNEELMKINEAKSVLLDKEKRNLYDQGLYDTREQRGFRYQDDQNVTDIFKAFFGGNSGSFFSGGGQGGTFFTSSSGGRRQEQRTYYYL
ncbi:hypothetical protein GVAV_000524 [Gurleya vavrai]